MNAVFGKLVLDRIIAKLVEGRARDKQWRPSIREETIRLLILRTKEVLLSEPSLLKLEAPMVVVGDIHGQYLDLLEILHVGGDPSNHRYLFLGDYVDRSDRGIQVLCLLMAYKLKYPDNVFLLRGNHECEEMNDDGGFRDECLKYYSETLYKDFQTLFNCLPPAAVISNKIFCVHAGLSPDLTSMKAIKDIKRPCPIPMEGLLCDLVWSDPSDQGMGFTPSPRLCSYIFGRDIVDEFMKRFDFDLIVRGHECCDGYCFAFDRRLVTVFSAPNYCGCERNAAGILFVDKELSCRFVLIRETKPLRRGSMVKPDTLEIIN